MTITVSSARTAVRAPGTPERADRDGGADFASALDGVLADRGRARPALPQPAQQDRGLPERTVLERGREARGTTDRPAQEDSGNRAVARGAARAADRATENAARAADRATEVADRAADRATDKAARAADRATEMADRAADRATDKATRAADRAADEFDGATVSPDVEAERVEHTDRAGRAEPAEKGEGAPGEDPRPDGSPAAADPATRTGVPAALWALLMASPGTPGAAPEGGGRFGSGAAPAGRPLVAPGQVVPAAEPVVPGPPSALGATPQDAHGQLAAPVPGASPFLPTSAAAGLQLLAEAGVVVVTGSGETSAATGAPLTPGGAVGTPQPEGTSAAPTAGPSTAATDPAGGSADGADAAAGPVPAGFAAAGPQGTADGSGGPTAAVQAAAPVTEPMPLAATATGPDPLSVAGPAPAGAATTTSTAGAAGGRPAEAPPVAAQVARQVAVLRGGPDGTHTMTLVLTPETLGQVEVSVTVTEGKLDLTLRGASEHGRAALTDALPDLRRDLETAGLSVSKLAVDREGGSSSAGQQQAFGDRSGQQDRGADRARPWLRTADKEEGHPAPRSQRSASSGVDVRV